MPATIPITVTPEEQATLIARAEAQGVSVDALVRKAVLQIIHPAEATPLHQQLRGEDLERVFEELADLVPDSVPPLSAESLRRENLYSREDDQ
jgi:hypothetical protein